MTHERSVPLRTAASIAGAVLLAIVALALHPHTSGHPAALAELREMGALAARDRIVHGTLLLLLGALLTWFVSYSRRRGLMRPPILAGLVCFAVGIGSLIGAGLIDGFILPELTARFVAGSPAAQDAGVAILAACSVAVNVFTAFAIVVMAIAMSAWSIDLAYDRGESRIAGVVGFVCAALTVTVLVSGGPSLTPHTLMAVLCAQGLWYVWIAVVLARDPSGSVELRPEMVLVAES